MKRMKLRIDELRVDTFELETARRPARGTVHANMPIQHKDPVPPPETSVEVCLSIEVACTYNPGEVGVSEGGPCSYNVTECDV